MLANFILACFLIAIMMITALVSCMKRGYVFNVPECALMVVSAVGVFSFFFSLTYIVKWGL